MADDRYASEKLHVAVGSLATSPASLRERLRSAALSIHVLGPDDFSDPKLGTRFSAIADMLTWNEGEADEGRIPATLDAMNDEQARAVAEEIFSLYVALMEGMKEE